MNTFILHDTRPYPQTPVKNHLLINASLLAHGTTAATRKIAVGQLQTEIRSQLHQNYYVNLSVAMTMAPDAETYNALMQSINQVLSAENDDEAQWFALPVVIVAGCKQERTLPLTLPTEALTACLSNYPHLRALTQNTQWLPFLAHSDDLSGITPEQWWKAKQNSESAAAFLQTFEDKPLICPEGQSLRDRKSVV